MILEAAAMKFGQFLLDVSSFVCFPLFFPLLTAAVVVLASWLAAAGWQSN
jgi:hypothetical protein